MRDQKCDNRNALVSLSAGALQRALVSWGQTHFQSFPWRRPRQKWQALVAEILLVRTRATSAVQVYEHLIRRCPTLQEMANLSEPELRKLVKPLGLAWRVHLLKKLVMKLASPGTPPLEEMHYEELLELPGVGPYTASA